MPKPRRIGQAPPFPVPTGALLVPNHNRVTIGSNDEIGEVCLIIGDPLAEPPQFVTFTPTVARELGKALIVEADKAAGK